MNYVIKDINVENSKKIQTKSDCNSLNNEKDS